MKIISKKTYIMLLIICLILLVVLLFLDLNISIKLSDGNSSFTKLFHAIGEYPGAIALFIGSAIIFAYNPKKSTLLGFLMILLSLSGWFIFANSTARLLRTPETDEEKMLYLSIKILFAVVATAITFYIFKGLSSRELKKYNDWGKVAVFSMVVSSIIIFIINILWGRHRFMDMNPPYTEFTRWIIPQGVNGNRSFPSGAVSKATMILVFLAHVNRVSSKGIRGFLKIFIWGWPVVVALSCVISGENFLSDVIISFIITISIIYFGAKIYIKDSSRYYR